MKNVYFSRCLPQKTDPISIVLKERRAFIGYPAWRQGVKPRRGHLRKAVLDFYSSDEEWLALRDELENSKMSKQSRNFARAVTVGDIMVVPRPSHGVVYAGRVIRPFEVLDDPPWSDEYLQLLKAQDLSSLEQINHLADVAQCCEVDKFRPLPFTAVPAWVRRSFFGRSTFGRLYELPALDLNAYDYLSVLLDTRSHAVLSWTTDITEVQRRLTKFVGPASLEHLCVALLQLERPDEVWEHVGGSGDGGLDGIGALASDPSYMVGALQCKFVYRGEPIVIAGSEFGSAPYQVLAFLLHPDVIPPIKGFEIWTRMRIAELVTKHAEYLPIAKTMRVGLSSSTTS